MRCLACLLASLALTVAAAPAAASGSLPPLPHSPLMDRGMQSTDHGSPVRPTPPFRSGFWVERGKYRVGVSTYGGGLSLEVWRGGRKQRSMTAYLARGVARPERLQAAFGNFGRVSMRFRPSRNREPGRRCSFGRVLISQHGLFLGKLSFRGEDDYVSVRLHRAKGTILRLGKRCHVHRRHHFDPSDLDFLFRRPEAVMLTISREGVDSTAVLAIAAKQKSAFVAVHDESRGKLAIVRLAEVHKPGTLRFDEALASGRLTAPRPFRGTGRYRALPDGSQTWTGDLTVNFPGAPRFPLTGPNFETLLEVPF